MKRMTKMIGLGLALSLVILCGVVDAAGAKDLKEYYEEGLRAYNATRYHAAVEIWQQGVNLAEEQGREQVQAAFFTMIGLSYSNLSLHQKSLEYHQKALQLTRKTGNIKVEEKSLSNIGLVYHKLGQYRKALEYQKKALRIARKIGHTNGERTALTMIGLASGNLGWHHKSLEYHQRALEIIRKIADVRSEGTTLNSMGLAYEDLGQYQKAIECYQKALDIGRKIGHLKDESSPLTKIGLAYGKFGQYEKALQYHQEALDAGRKIGDVEGEAGYFTNIGLVYYELGEYQKAIEYHQKALEICKRIGKGKEEGSALTNIGVAYHKLVQYQTALVYHQKALAVASKVGDTKGEAGALTHIGLVHDKLGHYQKAIEYHQKALLIGRKINDVEVEMIAHGNIGLAYSDLGQYQKALEYQQKALDVDRKIEDVKGEGRSLTNIAGVYLNLGQYQKAFECYQKALNIKRKTGDVRGEGRALTNIGVICYELGQYLRAIECYQRALDIHRKMGDIEGEGAVTRNIGAVYDILGQHQKAIEWYQRALDIEKKTGNMRGEGRALTNIGVAYSKLSQYQKALEYYRKAIAICRKIGDLKGEGTTLHNLGCSILSAGKPNQAEMHLESAVEVWESIRRQVKTGRERTGFQSTLPGVYGSLAAARLARGDQHGAFEAVERGRAKSFLDLLATRAAGTKRSKKRTAEIAKTERQLAAVREKTVELASAPVGAKTRAARTTVDQQISELNKKRLELIDQLRKSDPELGSLVVVDPPTLNEIQALLPPGIAMVEYFHPGKHTVSGREHDQLWIFVLLSGGLHFKAVDVSKSDLEKALEKYAKLVADGSSNPKSVEAAGAKLYKWLIEPIEPLSQLTDSETLVIVPWGSMFKVPFAALGPKAGKPLGVKKSIVMAPSAGVYRYLVKKRLSGRGKVLAIGNPKTAMTPLPGAEKEAREIAGLFGKSTIYTKNKATEVLIKKDYAALGRPDVVHLACHGLFNEAAPQLSHLALTPDQKNDGKLEMHELFDLDWRGVSLVTMSACSSGKGKLGAGDDLVGLTRGFMFAGAPSILCSLWDVDDEATRTLMVSFYKNYLSGMSKPEALRKAQVAMQKNKKWSHPYFWSAFVLFGDWE